MFDLSALLGNLLGGTGKAAGGAGGGAAAGAARPAPNPRLASKLMGEEEDEEELTGIAALLDKFGIREDGEGAGNRVIEGMASMPQPVQREAVGGAQPQQAGLAPPQIKIPQSSAGMPADPGAYGQLTNAPAGNPQRRAPGGPESQEEYYKRVLSQR